MRSPSLSLNSGGIPSLQLPRSVRASRSQCPPPGRHFDGASRLKVPGMVVQRRRCRSQEYLISHRAFDEGAVDIVSFDNWSDTEGASGYTNSSSEGEDSDGELILNQYADVDLPGVRVSTNEALTVTAHRFAMLARRQKKRRMRYGALINLGLITFLTTFLLLVDFCAWRIVRLPLESFYLTRPFFLSAVLVACAGYVCVPLLDAVNIHQIIRKEGPAGHSLKKITPTMGGLFLVPIGVAVAQFTAGFSSIQVIGAAAATLAYAVIGFLDDNHSLIKNHNYGLPSRLKLLLEAAVGIIFSVWLDCISISSPYGMKGLVPLPAPLGLICLGKFYTFLSSFCFVSMGNGVNLTDGLDGLAGGTAALAFVAMSIAVLPICADLAIFGASMAGACVGFLLHNRYRASIFMGDTGSLALGGALASMAACTGMFFPLFISSGVFVLEALSVILQVSYFKATKFLHGSGLLIFRMAPFHHHLELCGLTEPTIVACAYALSAALSLCAAYLGLISA